MKARSKKRVVAVPAAPVPMQPSHRREMILLAVGVLLLCGVFLGKAYNMDDPLVVWTAQRIAQQPWNFYGFDVNWYGYSTPMELTDLNPPGAAYYASVFGVLANWRESAMHGGFAFIAAALILGIYRLARRIGSAPLPAALIALISPGIFVSMGTVMTDLLMTALWVWATLFWLRGLDEDDSYSSLLSGFLIGLGALAKYFALSLVPLFCAVTLLFARKRWRRMVWLLIPLAMIVFFDLYTGWLYGVGQIRGILGMFGQYYEIYTVNHWRKMLTGLTFLGAGAAPVLFLAPWLWRRTARTPLWLGAVGMVLVTVALQQSGWQIAEPKYSFGWWFWLQYGLWLLAGAHIIALVIAEIWTERDRDSVLLGLWIGGTLFYGIFVYHFINIRVLLPAFPAIALVCGRRLTRLRAKSKAKTGLPKPVWGVAAASLVLSLSVAWADIDLANSARAAAERIAPEKRSGRTWFSGHWGFQYYMEARGAKPIDIKRQDFRLGDTVVTPMNASNRYLARPRIVTRDESFEIPVCRWMATMRGECGAGFYADLWGPLPFVLGPVPPEQYQVTVLGGR